MSILSATCSELPLHLIGTLLEVHWSFLMLRYYSYYRAISILPWYGDHSRLFCSGCHLPFIWYCDLIPVLGILCILTFTIHSVSFDKTVCSAFSTHYSFSDYIYFLSNGDWYSTTIRRYFHRCLLNSFSMGGIPDTVEPYLGGRLRWLSSEHLSGDIHRYLGEADLTIRWR